MHKPCIGLLWLGLLSGCQYAGSGPAQGPGNNGIPVASSPSGKTLQAFADEAALDRLLAKWEADADEFRSRNYGGPVMPPPELLESVASDEEMASAIDALLSGEMEADSVTNVQTAGVDEGGIVKQHGDHLVILRRGRLFTIGLGGDSLRPISAVDAFAPDIDPGAGAWYDEMLVSDDTVVVIGYSYQRGGTEIGLFDLDAGGVLRYRATYHLRSNDYYASNNSASRLIGNQLIFYTPLSINPQSLREKTFYPALRRWQGEAASADFQRILPATRIYQGDGNLKPGRDGVALHTVTRCDLSKPEMRCDSTGVIGLNGRVFYVSADSVYIWTISQRSEAGDANRSSVFRMPLDGSAPSMLQTTGTPPNQLSFLQDKDGHLNVLVTAQGDGEGMWSSERTMGGTALLRVPLEKFGDAAAVTDASDYQPLPPISRYNPQNRFIGDWLVYGGAGVSGNGYALRYTQRQSPRMLPLQHRVERIEALGRDAIIIGSAGSDLHFTSVALGRDEAQVGARYVRPDAAQGETRTHGFFYKRQSAQEGIVGLPIVMWTPRGMQRYLDQSAAVLYLRNRELQLTPIGELSASPETAVDDGCRASCVDWYGNARPLFIGDRVFALMGYELVEGSLREGRISERRRIDYAPTTPRLNIAY
ncbi:MAG: beta-propeller domain-containing protein [Xanthomonadaceae bacterium]|jgi:hypothetical protein|nr:beta-propeller domain-containing protein [Xanthomonadaceae bacterium]